MMPSEAEAVQNMLAFMPRDVQVALHKAASTYGMTRGPFNHGALGCKALRVGYANHCEDAVWSQEMVNGESTVRLIVERLLKNYTKAPAGLRLSASADHIQKLQKLAKCFEMYMARLATRVDQTTMENESPQLKEHWINGVYDDFLLQAVKDQPNPIVVDALPEFKIILQKIEHDMNAKHLQRKHELARQVDSSSYTTLCQARSVLKGFLGFDRGPAKAYGK
mgnify:CR=1 FL=1